MKLYIANKTCSETVQIVANELHLNSDEFELIHYDPVGGTTSDNSNFAEVNPLGYVPALVLNKEQQGHLTETTVIASYLADLYPESGLVPPNDTLERVQFNSLLNFIATEIAQKHIPLMRNLLTDQGVVWTRNKLVRAYTTLDQRLSDGRPWLLGDQFTVADAYVFGTMWHERSGTDIGHLNNLISWKQRIDQRPSVQKAMKDETELYAKHQAQINKN